MAQNYAYDNDWDFLFDDEEETDSNDWDFLFDDEEEEEEPEYDVYEPMPIPAPEAVAPEPVVPEDTEYNWAGAFKQAGYQAARAMGGSLPSMVGKLIPGDDPIERIGTENKAQYDAWMKESPDVQKHQQSVAKETEGFLPEVIGSVGPTLAGLTTSIIPVVGPYLAAAEFLDLNKEEIYEQAKTKGADEETAEIVSWAGGAINSALDMTGLGALKRVFKPGKKITKFLVNYALATQIEGGTESVQDVVGKVATEYAIKPKDESESNFMARMWDKKDELVADAWHAYTIGAGTTALLGVPAGVHQAATGQLTGDVDPTEKDKITSGTKKARDIAILNDVDPEAATGIITAHAPIADKTSTDINRIDEDTTKKAQARQLQEAKLMKEEQRLADVPMNREQFFADVVNGEASPDQFEDYGLTQEEGTPEPPPAPPEPEVAPEPIQKDALPGIKDVIGKLPEGTMVDVEIQELDENGKIIENVDEAGDIIPNRTKQVDARKELKTTGSRLDAISNIIGCLGS